MVWKAAVFPLLCWALPVFAVSADGTWDDRYLEGYAAARLDQRLGPNRIRLRVNEGKLTLDPASMKGVNPKEVERALGDIPGLRIRYVQLADAGVVIAYGEDAVDAAPPADPIRRETGWLPPAKAFESLIADPRWPRFSASVQAYQGDSQLNTAGAANFGATLPFYGWKALDAVWQIGLQAGVFSIFNLEAKSTDLVNADYYVSLPLSVHKGPFSAQARLFHQSSHLGDEYLLPNPVNRVNLSYEGMDLLMSWNFGDIFRIYGGGGGLFHTDPASLDPWFVQGGFHLTSPWPLFAQQVYPIAALDIQSDEEGGWDVSYSARAGLDFRSEWLAGRRLQLLVEYFNGRSPNGQFFERHIEYVGGGLHFFF